MTSSLTAPKVALVCDWLTEIGGAERVLLALHRLYPDAPIYTSQYRPSRIDWFSSAAIRTGWLNRFPAPLRRFLGPLRQFYFSHLDLSSYDLVISVTGAEAKAVLTSSTSHHARHLCYCHVPTQYYWGKYDQYLKNPGFGWLNPLVRFMLKLLVKPLRQADYRSAQAVDTFITISDYAASEIKQHYNRESLIIHPPVAVEVFHNTVEMSKTKTGNCQEKENHKQNKSQIKPLQNQKIKQAKSQVKKTEHQTSQFFTPVENLPISSYFINFSRQVTWKRQDLIIKACIKAKQPLLLIGDGPEHRRLYHLAKDHLDLIFFLPPMSQSELKTYLIKARAFIFPSEEPFGIAPVEALAAGCPVLAYAKGGAKDFIVEGKNGLFFSRQTANSIVDCFRRFESIKLASPLNISASVNRFSTSSFNLKIKRLIHEKN